MTIHQVKSWSHLFDAIVSGAKAYDLRKNDRNYQIGDELVLARYDNIAGRFTGDVCKRTVSYITSSTTPCAVSSAVLPNEYCILGFET
jgi:Domain of unknown function (DUF3850)